MCNTTTAKSSYDVLIVGAGLSGICSLYHLTRRFPSWRVTVLEAGSGVGGTWFWNKYPGARFDSESVSYGYSFDEDLLQEWNWKEAYASQPEILRYIERVSEKHGLAKNIQFNTRIRSVRWQDEERIWLVVDDVGKEYRTRFFLSCMGYLSSPTLPNIPGAGNFRGKAFHTSRWPADLDVTQDFANKRIGVIGTGATGIQTITALSKEPNIRSVHVFQRTPNWSAPLRNADISADEMSKYKSRYDAIFQRCAETASCLLHELDPRKSCDVTDEERLELWEKLYAAPGFGKWLGTFSDTYTDAEANRLYSDFMASKIRARVHDQVVAESLIPKDHGFGTRRVPLESGYFEAFNKPNVHLVDLQKTPITEIHDTGIRTDDDSEHELDVLIFATGFNAVTGALDAVEWTAKDTRSLLGESNPASEKQPIWTKEKPETFLGISAHGMPNFFMVLGPHQPFGNATRCIEHAVQVISDLLQFCKDNEYSYVEPSKEAAEEWTRHVLEVGSAGADSDNKVLGKQEQVADRYVGSAIEFRRRCEACMDDGWKGFTFLA